MVALAGGGWTILDRALALLIGGVLFAITVVAAFTKLEWFDWGAYALPGANLVERGRLALPQFGLQMGLDRDYLLNAPWMVVGPIPWFWALGVDRLSYLAGLVAIDLLCVALYVLALRKVFGLRSLAASAFLASAFVANRAFLIEIYLQRYSVLGFGMLLLAFWPAPGPAWRWPWWKWLAAGMLPIIHPGLVFALGFWGLGLLGFPRVEAVETDANPEEPGLRPARWAGPLTFAALIGLGCAWFVRPSLLREQLLPHIRFGNYRSLGTLQILVTSVASKVAVPTVVFNVAMSALGLLIVAAWAAWPSRRRLLSPVLTAALAVAFVQVYDALRGFGYIFYYVLGLGPWMLWPFRRPGPRRVALAVLSAFALTNLLIASRLDRGPVLLVDTAETRDYLVSKTRPADHIVVGPPFVLASARPELPGGRVVERVVPQPYYLSDFDDTVFRREINGRAWVYIGEPDWFTRTTFTAGRGADLFPGAEIEEDSFHGLKVIVARARTEPPKSP